MSPHPWPPPSRTRACGASTSELIAAQARRDVRIGPGAEAVAPHYAGGAVPRFGPLGDEAQTGEVRDHGVHEDLAVELGEVLLREQHLHDALGVETVPGPQVAQHVELLVAVEGLEHVEREVLH